MAVKGAARKLGAMRSSERKPRVLMAVSPGAAGRICRILEGCAVERHASVKAVADALARSYFDMVIVDLRFDRSNAIEAVKTVLAQAQGAPVVCVRAAPFCSLLGEATLEAFCAATNELGVDCFVDVLQFPDDDAGNARVRDARPVGVSLLELGAASADQVVTLAGGHGPFGGG